jgi:hypothetical protein
MHGGTPPHFLCTVTHHLNQIFSEQWTAQGGPVNWPAWSPDLNPLDFWLWGHLKTSAYSGPINDVEVLQNRLSGDFQQTLHFCQMSWKLHWNAWESHRTSAVKITWTSPISQQATVSGYMLTTIFFSLKGVPYPLNLGNQCVCVRNFLWLFCLWAKAI